MAQFAPRYPAGNTPEQRLNKQAFDAFTNQWLNSETLPSLTDPQFNKLYMEITRVLFREMPFNARMGWFGTDDGMESRPGITQEIYMRERKVQNFPMDNDPRPTQFGVHDIVDDDIDTRYHALQTRTMYDYSIMEQELRRFMSNHPSLIGDLMASKARIGVKALNRFYDNLKRYMLTYYVNYVKTQMGGTGSVYPIAAAGGDRAATPEESTPFNDTMTQAGAWNFLNQLRDLQLEFERGTTRGSVTGDTIQVPNLTIAMPERYLRNLTQVVYPSTFSDLPWVRDLMPQIVSIDSFGGEQLMDAAGTAPVTPTWDAKGMPLMDSRARTDVFSIGDQSDVVALVYSNDAVHFNRNFEYTGSTGMDPAKLVENVYMHEWYGGWYTDLIPAVAITGTEG